MNLRPSPGFSDSGFTLAEMLTAAAVFSLMVAGVLSAHIFGMRMYNMTSTRLNSSRNAREALSQVRDDIRTATTIYVGNGNSAGFTNAPQNLPQTGNALQLCPTSDTNTFVRYYVDPADQTLKRKASGSKNIATVASYVTNQVVFRAEDYLANLLTNSLDTRVVEMTLEFSQWELPLARAPGGAAYEYCRLQTRTTRRSLQ